MLKLPRLLWPCLVHGKTGNTSPDILHQGKTATLWLEDDITIFKCF